MKAQVDISSLSIDQFTGAGYSSSHILITGISFVLECLHVSSSSNLQIYNQSTPTINTTITNVSLFGDIYKDSETFQSLDIVSAKWTGNWYGSIESNGVTLRPL